VAVINIDSGAEYIINWFNQSQDQILSVSFDIYFGKPGGDTNKIGGWGPLLKDNLACFIAYLETAAVDQFEFKGAQITKNGGFAVTIGAIGVMMYFVYHQRCLLVTNFG
jgi:hypothetical protein